MSYTLYYIGTETEKKDNKPEITDTVSSVSETEIPPEIPEELPQETMKGVNANSTPSVVTTTVITQPSMTSTTTEATTTTKEIVTTTLPATTTQIATTTPNTTTKQPITTTTRITTTKQPIITTTQPITTTTQNTKTEPVAEKGTYILPYALTDNDWFMICKVVCSETGYCGERQQKAVAYTIYNRIIYAATHTNSPYPNSVYGILHQPAQYDAINYWRPDTRLQPGGSLWNNTMRIIKEAVYEPDFTNGAIGYYDPTVCGYLSVFENNPAIYCCYTDGNARFFSLTQK